MPGKSSYSVGTCCLRLLSPTALFQPPACAGQAPGAASLGTLPWLGQAQCAIHGMPVSECNAHTGFHRT
eukprot:3059006-Pyramimonas_sp.AAC.1